MKHITEKMPIKAGKYDNVPENYTGTVYICPMHLEVRDIEMVKRRVWFRLLIRLSQVLLML